MSHFFITVIILGLAAFITNKVPILNKYRIPVSLSSSILVLALFTYNTDLKAMPIYASWKTYPNIFIALIFAALFLERSETHNHSSDFNESLAQTILIWISILGQTFIGLLFCVLIFKPLYDLPYSFASVLETGFAGGHGTAVAMKQSFIETGIPGGLEYGLFSATVGLLCGIIGGIFLIKRQNLPTRNLEEDIPDGKLDPIKAILTLSLIFGAFQLGSLMKDNVLLLLDGISDESILKIFKRIIPSLPLFVYALIASVILKFLLKWTKQDYIIDNNMVNFASNFFMELLIFAGIASIDMKVISEAIVPLMLLFTAGFIWNIFCHFYVRPKILKDEYSFELSLINFGMLNGTTGIGIMLLKMVDPECKTKALKIYAESSPFTSPFIGGGILTLTMPYLLNHLGPSILLPVFTISILLLYFFGLKIKLKLIKG